jgi:hypothetical protein
MGVRSPYVVVGTWQGQLPTQSSLLIDMKLGCRDAEYLFCFDMAFEGRALVPQKEDEGLSLHRSIHPKEYILERCTSYIILRYASKKISWFIHKMQD